MKKIIVVMFMALISQLASADIYKCTIDGRVTFSQQPCSDNAVKIPMHLSVDTDKANKQSHDKRRADVKSVSKKLESARLARKYRNEIKQAEKQRKNLNKEKNNRLKKIKSRQWYKGLGYGFDTFSDLKKDDLKKAKNDYATKIDNIKSNIKNLQNKLKRLPK